MMAPDLADAVDRIARQAGDYATRRDDAATAPHATPDDMDHWNTAAHYYACAAAIAAHAGLCDISTAIDYEWRCEENGTKRPTLEHYRAAIVRAVESNR